MKVENMHVYVIIVQWDNPQESKMPKDEEPKDEDQYESQESSVCQDRRELGSINSKTLKLATLFM